MDPRVRLGALVLGLVALGIAVVATQPISEDGLRDLLDPLGWAAPIAFVPISGVLGALFVPGPLLAGASGLLFGTWVGFFATLGGAIFGGVLCLRVSRGVGREQAAELETERIAALTALARRHGVAAVVIQRLIPSVPDAPCSYAFGLAGLRTWQMVLGTAIGSAPRAFSYTSLGDALGDGDGTQALIAGGVFVVTSIVGLVLAAVVFRRHASPIRRRGMTAK